LGATDYLLKPNSGVRFGEIARQIQCTWLAPEAGPPEENGG
jgi:hypothetical protein